MPSERQRPIYVTGHKRPDTDSIMSALAYADLLRRRDGVDALAIRQGEIQPEAAFVLRRFGLPEPPLITDLRLRVSDVMVQRPICTREEATILEVSRKIRKNDIRSVPVLSDDGELVGIVTIEDLAKVVLEGIDSEVLGQEAVSVWTLVHSLEGRLLAGDPMQMIRERVVIAGSSVERIVHRLEPGCVVIVGDREDVQKAVLEAGAGALVVTGDVAVSDEVLDLARERGVALICVGHTSFQTARLIDLSVPVRLIASRSPRAISPDTLVSEARHELAGRVRSLCVVEEGLRLVGLVTRSTVLEPEPNRVVLVDHSERSQSIEGLEELRVEAIIDHHRVGDVQTPEPILYRCEPVGCTCTLIAEMYQEARLTPDAPIAGAMLAAILSDTLIYHSPTTTPRDRAAGEWLAGLAAVEEGFGRAMLAAAETDSEEDGRDVVLRDFKEIDLPIGRVGVGQWITADPSRLRARRQEVLEAMERVRDDHECAAVLLMVTDVVEQSTDLWIAGEESRIAEAFGREPRGPALHLPGVVSRKRQVIPKLARLR